MKSAKFTSSKIIYLTQRFRPQIDAPSKEVILLAQHFQGQIFNLHLDGYANFKYSSGLTSYHFLYYPLGFLPLYFAARKNIFHLYTSLCDRPYLPYLPKEKMVVTSSNFFRRERIQESKKHLQKVNAIIIPAEVQRQELITAGIDEKKIKCIYPAIDINTFSYHKATGIFTLLNASCPGKVRDLKKRGIHLLLEADQHLSETTIKLLWREAEFHLFQEKIKHRNLKNILIENKIHTEMNQQYAQIHATIIPYLQFDEYLKLIPVTVMESLAAGKPVLVSSQTGVAEIVSQAKCGVVFAPTPSGLLDGIADLKKNYWKYQGNCRSTAENFFSKKSFVKKYEEIYEQIHNDTRKDNEKI